MIIDSHTHIGKEYLAVDLLKSMDQSKIDKALVFAMGDGFECSNDYLLEQIAPHSDRLYGVAAANLIPSYEPQKIVNEIKQLENWYGEGKIKAVKFYTGYDHYYPTDNLIRLHLQVFEKIKCPAIFHCGDCLNDPKLKAKLKYAHPLHIDDVAVDYPDMNFIIAHMGFPWHRDAAEVCYKNENVYSDISGFVYGDFKYSDTLKFKKVITEFLDICSPNKLLFGTDYPISNQKSYLTAIDDSFGELLTPQTLSKNTEKVFNL